MLIRSFMFIIDQVEGGTLYVLVESVVKDCAVYMRSGLPPNFDVYATVVDVALHGSKVSARDADALPFKIPSDLTYRQ